MKTLDYRSPKIALRLTLFASMIAFAQTEKITLKIFPEPNQTVRIRIVHDAEFDMNFEGEPSSEAALSGPMKMTRATVFGMTLKIGAPDKEGNTVSELTYDEAISEATMNGQPTQTDDKLDNLIGKQVTLTVNKQGEIVGVKIPPDLGLAEEAFKQVLKSLYGSLPRAPIGVGEVAMVPLDFTLPLPAPDAGPLKFNGQTRLKLLSIEKDATGRIAKFDQTADGQIVTDLEIPSPNRKIKMSLDLKLSGAGGMVMNVDKGVMKSNDLKATFSGKIKMTAESSEVKLPTINFQGKMNVAVTGSN